MSGLLLAPCEHCGIDPGRILRARQAVLEAACQLGLDPDRCVVAPNLEYETGALHALEWVLGAGGEQFFELHVAALEKLARMRQGAAPARLDRSA